MEVITKYCQASGQLVNLEKSSLILSKNTLERTQMEVESCVQIKKADNPITYLGIPSLWGKTRMEVLRKVYENVLMQLQRWKQKALSLGGKEVLIKAVACAIPTYAMTCFMLPKKLCRELNSAMAKFWWGSKDKEIGIHWKSWESLTMSKDSGGMGFKDLITFNKALLVKQGWRLIQNPDSLWARIFKGVYFPQTVSYKLKRDFLKESLLWQIGNGNKVSIWEDRWVKNYGPGILIPEYAADSYFPEEVEEWIDWQRKEWKGNEVGKWISAEAKEAIQCIPIGQRETMDRLAWLMTKKWRLYCQKGISDYEAGNN